MTGIARVTPDGLLRFRGETLRCALGAGGIRADKIEGDGATPIGLLPVRRILWRADRGARPACALPAEPIAPEDGWCDDPGHRDYNRPVRLPHPARHERLWRDDTVYDVIGVLGWNDAPVVPGRGSAIFLHVARPGLGPTEGCVALPEGELRRLLAAGMDALEILG
ncbi:L,D-transpeptidase family protein [Roseomonas eburnea]|uniref:L,D-transpeptidase family protein n=1 Tax=Neoroseomonas eburnea TaxID=1346889 RepID=A0A9X9XCT8_9PROT|nr:L,D-transpeptidase family protein [Neoroseomonas eburnea]MBR0681524.1 L,D-transpeptidase family protein [Neoroseomonas eburnea]